MKPKVNLAAGEGDLGGSAKSRRVETHATEGRAILRFIKSKLVRDATGPRGPDKLEVRRCGKHQSLLMDSDAALLNQRSRGRLGSGGGIEDRSCSAVWKARLPGLRKRSETVDGCGFRFMKPKVGSAARKGDLGANAKSRWVQKHATEGGAMLRFIKSKLVRGATGPWGAQQIESSALREGSEAADGWRFRLMKPKAVRPLNLGFRGAGHGKAGWSTDPKRLPVAGSSDTPLMSAVMTSKPEEGR